MSQHADIWIRSGGGLVEGCELGNDAVELALGLDEAEHGWAGEVGERARVPLAVA